MNTPDTEWEAKVKEAVEHICDLSSFGQPLHPNDIKHHFTTLLTSRDTYWKERVRKEVEGMPSVFHADNIPDSIQPGDIIPGKPYICRNTLLDKLK